MSSQYLLANMNYELNMTRKLNMALRSNRIRRHGLVNYYQKTMFRYVRNAIFPHDIRPLEEEGDNHKRI